ncbi:conserved Plasmodium protein, unknown function [Plasmodium relictum]|uniref:Condensin II complex subunit H2 N-terminal domain-containing protein n=1 Tax=Plasmodium relictum TaxID=85471 RepID=A0A1J1H2B3_PLARL|nr:conserved Plasmodium protein, unknown function [Plasmodium relictum]CRG98829.1 conserved Plasmodium protein, unknown function [Plasmodium relictum]
MSSSDELSILMQNLQKCNNTNECINFDLTSTLQGFLNHLDKNIFENSEKINENENEKDFMNSFTSAAIFVENCVKIFSQKIEYLHNLAHNTLYNIYKENKNSNSSKKQLITAYEEEYLFINEIKNLKNTASENEIIEDDLLVKTIPLPTFLFSENIKKKENNDGEINTLNNNSNTKNDLESNNGIEHINEFEILEKNSLNSLNFDKMFLENDGVLLLDINDYNIFINDQFNFSIQNKNSTILFEKYDFFSRHSTYLSNNLSKYIEEKRNVEDIYKINHIGDLLCEKLCFDIFLFKQDFFDYDFSLGILRNKKNILNKYDEQKKCFYILDENTHTDGNKSLTVETDIKILPNYYVLNCQNIKNCDDFFRYMQPNEILDIIKKNIKNEKNGKEEISDKENQDEKEKEKEKETYNQKYSNDQKIFHQIKIPELYTQKLGLNFSFYYLEPLIYNLIKDLKRRKNVEKFFSLDFYDDKPNYDCEILIDDEFNDGKNQENRLIEEKLTLDNFVDARSFNDDINNFPLEVFEKKDSDQFFVSFDDEIHDRVNKWNLFLEEKLEILRKQPKYDVDDYKKSIINYTMNSGDKIYFSNILKDKDQYQICRNFLTTLMLINVGILDIKKLNDKNSSNDVSNYEIHIKRENVQEYLSFSKRFKNTSFTIKDKKRKTDAFNGIKDILPLKKKPHKI